METSSTATATIAKATTVVLDYYDAGEFVQNYSGNASDNDSDNGGPFECNQEVNANSLSDFVVYGVFVNLIALFGILGNTVSMIILSRPQMKSSINYLLIGLARCDTALIVIAVSSTPRTSRSSEYLAKEEGDIK